MNTPPSSSVYALLPDGTTVEIRPAWPSDLDAVRSMYAAMSPDNVHLRFFNTSRHAAELAARRACRDPDTDHAALLALLDTDVVGIAELEPAEEPEVADIAFAVADHMHGRGVATLLLEHLVSLGQRRGLRAFHASALAGNIAMLRVFASAGLPAQRRMADDGIIELTFPLPRGDADPRLERYLDIVASREGHADVASLRHLLLPASVAVVGAGGADPAACAILRNIVSAGFRGRLYAVGVPGCHAEGAAHRPAMAAVPERVDLALVTAPAAAVNQTAAECGRRGARSVLVTAAGLDAAAGAELLAICRRHGMRLAGPDSCGTAVPGIGLDATLARCHPGPGPAGVAVQSSGVGIAILERLSAIGIGVSSFASLGDKYDVSGNDLLMWWEQDPATRLAVLCLESFGNPRKFARTARRLGHHMPVLTVLADPSATQDRPARSPATAAATPRAAREALLHQAGVVAAGSLGELVEAVALMSTQPLPDGDRVAVVSDAADAARLAAGACRRCGLRLATLTARAQRRLRRILPPGAAVGGPVTTGAEAGPARFRACLETVAADDAVDMVLAITVATALTDLGPAAGAVRPAKPLAAAVPGQAEAVRLLGGGQGRTRPGAAGPPGPAVPAYDRVESAARALGHAARHQAWRVRPVSQVPDIAGIRLADARRVVDRLLTSRRTGCWLQPARAAELLSCYGIPLAASEPGAGEATGIEVLIGVVQDPLFGPLVVLSAASTRAGGFHRHATRLTPLTGADTDEMIQEVCAGHTLFDRTGGAGAQLAGLADVLWRVSRLADDVPEVAELSLGPVAARAGGVAAGRARVRIAPAQPQDPFLRRLR